MTWLRLRSPLLASVAPGLGRAWRRCALALGLALSLGLAGCSLPPLEGRSVSTALPPVDTQDSLLGRSLTPGYEAHPELSGVLPLADAHDAFAARYLLARAAERSLDVQYYIWRNDITGILMLDALHEAAERGVRVRLLLDDNGVQGLDEVLAALDGHPNIEVRLFNPFPLRQPKLLGFVTDFSRLNRRMHNKSFTADSQATIIGGRNIGDEYFGATDDVLFADLDVLAVGGVAEEMGQDFDRYWNSESAYPVELLLPPVSETATAMLAQARADAAERPVASGFLDAVRDSAFIEDLRQGTLPFIWADVTMVSDDPRKVLAEDDLPPNALLPGRLVELLREPRETLDLVSPYFVPMDAGVEALTTLTENGVTVRVLTNALEATDVAAVHAGYAKHRPALLAGGIELFEMRRSPANDLFPQRAGLFGSAGASLHAKTFAVDGKRVFIGSLNFDPRSVHLNTELGFLIESPELAQSVHEAFTSRVPQAAYTLELADDGSISWKQAASAEEPAKRYTSDPNAGLTRRAIVELLSVLPIDWML